MLETQLERDLVTATSLMGTQQRLPVGFGINQNGTMVQVVTSYLALELLIRWHSFILDTTAMI